MRVAIIYSGGMRSFERCLPNHRWIVHRHFPGAKFYVCTELDEDAHKADLLEAATIKRVKQPEMVIPPGCPTTWTPGQPYMHEPYHISVDPRAVLGQLWMLRQAWALYEEANDPADLIIRIRPDLWFHSFKMPELPNVLNLGDVAYVPWWGSFGPGCNDRFALLGRSAARSYFTTYDRVSESISNGAPLHPETLIGLSLERFGLYFAKKLKAEFSTLRKTGEMRPPEITTIDLAHAAMR